MPTKPSVKYALLVFLFIVHLLPIWMFKFVPTQDGMSHVYNAHVLHTYHSPDSLKIQEFFQLNLTPFPNWTSHAFMALLMSLFPPLVCEKILVSLCIILLPVALMYFLNAVDKGRTALGLVGFIFAYGFPLHMGFYNFVLSVSLYFFILGFWWRRKHGLNFSGWIGLYLLLGSTYFSHYVSYLLAIISITFFALCSCISEGQRVKRLLLFLGGMVPAYVVAVSYGLQSTRGFRREYQDGDGLWEYFINMGSIVSFGDFQIFIGRVLLAFFLGAVILALWHQIRGLQAMATRESVSGSSRFQLGRMVVCKMLNGRCAFLCLAIILTVIYFKAPTHLGSGGDWINHRIHIFIFLVLLPFINMDFQRCVRCVMTAVIITLSLLNLGCTVYAYDYLNKEMMDMTSNAGLIREHSTVTIYPNQWAEPLSYPGKNYFSPFLHLSYYFCLGQDVVYLHNYEAIFNYFPVDFKSPGLYAAPRADYVIVWQSEFDELVGLQREGYNIIDASKHHFLLYREGGVFVR